MARICTLSKEEIRDKLEQHIGDLHKDNSGRLFARRQFEEKGLAVEVFVFDNGVYVCLRQIDGERLASCFLDRIFRLTGGLMDGSLVLWCNRGRGAYTRAEIGGDGSLDICPVMAL